MARQTGELITKIVADAKGFQSGISKADKSLKTFEKTSTKIAGKMKLLGAAILAAIAVVAVKAAKTVVKFGKELVVLGQKSLSLKKSFKSLATSMGANWKRILADMKIATRGTIAEVDLLASANKMMLMGMDPSIFDEIMEIARRTAKATGQDINYITESLAMGLGRQSKMILDNLGIVFQTADAYTWYAETIGKTSAQLTENEKRLGFQTYAMKIARENVEKLGEDVLTLTEIGGIFTTEWKDLKAFIGERLVEAINAVVERFGGWEVVMEGVHSFIDNTLKPAIEGIIGKVVEFGEKLKEADYSEFEITLEGLKLSLGELAKSFAGVGGAMDETKSDFEGFLRFLRFVGNILMDIIRYGTMLVETIFFIGNSIGAWIGWFVILGRAYSEFAETGDTTVQKIISGFAGMAQKAMETKDLLMARLDEIRDHYMKRIGEIIDLEIPTKTIEFEDNMDDMLGRFQHMKSGITDISRTVTIKYKEIGWTGLREFQFGGIIPKTQAIIAHGGEMVLTREDQRNLFALIRQPRSIQTTYSSPITIQSLVVREEADIRKIAEELENLRILGSRSGGVR